MHVETLDADAVSLIARIDRSEHVEVEYVVTAGRLAERPVTTSEVPRWDPTGDGPHSVAGRTDFCRRAIAAGGRLLGCFDDQRLMGLAVVDPTFEGSMAWLAFLHVSRADRRCGAASALWAAATSIARDSGADRLYVSATPTGSAVGFYLRQGCVLADPVHPRLFEQEPHDVHLVCPLA